MNCPPVVYQVTQAQTVAGQPFRVGRISAGEMDVLEICFQADADATVQFFEGLPGNNSLGNPISLQAFVQQFQMWSKAGKVVFDDVYCVVQEGGVGVNVELRVIVGSRQLSNSQNVL